MADSSTDYDYVPAMDRAELQAVQKPLKERYREEPAAALIMLRADGKLDEEKIACKVDTGRALVEAGLHPATGGTGAFACSGDMLLEALVACAGVTLRSVATSLELDVTGSVHAEGDLDFRGTLGVDREASVGFTGDPAPLRPRVGRAGGEARQAARAHRALLRRRPDARRRRPARVLLLDLVGHQDRVDELVAAAVVPLAVALALEAERLVERDRGLVPGEDVQLELADPGLARPVDGCLHERPPHALPARVARDHQADVGDVGARGMRVAPDREAADDRPVVALGDEHGSRAGTGAAP